MPHILAKSLKDFELNSSKFKFIAKGEYLNLIGIELDGVEFLISQSQKGENFLIKYDKVTRVARLDLLKLALDEFIKSSNADVIKTNIYSKNLHNSNIVKKSYKFVKNINFFVNDFKSEKEIWIEIGFGTGRHLLYQAKKNPNIQFIGIEIYKPSIDILAKQIEIQNLNNIYILDYDARIFLEFIKSNSIGKIFVHFPVPWDKKPHRRIFSKIFIDEAIRVLKVSGKLELRTDSENYFNYSLKLFLNYKDIKFKVQKNLNLEISSKYEDRWKRQDKNIYDLHLKNIKNSKDVLIDNNFKFKDKVDFLKIYRNFKNSSVKYDDFILHFENIYKIDDSSGLIRITLGDFNKVERKYLYFSKNRVRYYQGDPIPTKANLKSHKKIKEWLNG